MVVISISFSLVKKKRPVSFAKNEFRQLQRRDNSKKNKKRSISSIDRLQLAYHLSFLSLLARATYFSSAESMLGESGEGAGISKIRLCSSIA